MESHGRPGRRHAARRGQHTGTGPGPGPRLKSGSPIDWRRVRRVVRAGCVGRRAWCGGVRGYVLPGAGGWRAEWDAARLFPLVPGWHVIFAQHNPSTGLVEVRTEAGTRYYTAEELADEVGQDPAAAGKAVLLLLCYAGHLTDLSVFGARFRDRRGRFVAAADGVVWISFDGVFVKVLDPGVVPSDPAAWQARPVCALSGRPRPDPDWSRHAGRCSDGVARRAGGAIPVRHSRRHTGPFHAAPDDTGRAGGVGWSSPGRVGRRRRWDAGAGAGCRIGGWRWGWVVGFGFAVGCCVGVAGRNGLGRWGGVFDAVVCRRAGCGGWVVGVRWGGGGCVVGGGCGVLLPVGG